MSKKKKTTRKAKGGPTPGVRRNPNDSDQINVTMRTSRANADWLTEASLQAGISRSGFLSKLVEQMRLTEASLNQSGLFDMFQPQIDKLLDQVVEQKLEARRGHDV